MTNKALISIFVILSISVFVQSSSYPTINKSILKKVFDGVKPYSDLSNAFYSVKGLELIGEALPAASQNVGIFERFL